MKYILCKHAELQAVEIIMYSAVNKIFCCYFAVPSANIQLQLPVLSDEELTV
jgi:hypothetical protein